MTTLKSNGCGCGGEGVDKSNKTVPPKGAFKINVPDIFTVCVCVCVCLCRVTGGTIFFVRRGCMYAYFESNRITRHRNNNFGRETPI